MRGWWQSQSNGQKMLVLGTVIFLGLLVVGGLLNNTGFAPEPQSETDADPKPAPTDRPEIVTLSGAGARNTDPISIRGGDYRVLSVVQGDCFYGLDLVPLEGGQSVNLTTRSEPGEYEDNVYGVPAGDYYLRVITGPPPRCPWAIALESR